jgi:hypothetical protein
MIVTDRFVFIHLHKSGGTFVNQLLLQCVPSARQIGYHLPYSELPDAYLALPVLGTVRNPWDYYVSWYFFQAGQACPNGLFRLCSLDGTLDFSETVRRLVQLCSHPHMVRALREVLPDGFRPAGLNLTKACLDKIAGRGDGFYSLLFERMYAGAPDVEIMPAEELRTHLEQSLTKIGVIPNPRASLFIKEAPRMNVSRHGPYKRYYNDDLRNMIEQLDAPVIERFGYQF